MSICNYFKAFHLFSADPEGPGCCALLLALFSIVLIVATLPFSLCTCIKVSKPGFNPGLGPKTFHPYHYTEKIITANIQSESSQVTYSKKEIIIIIWNKVDGFKIGETGQWTHLVERKK